MGYHGSEHQKGPVQRGTALLTPLLHIRANLWGRDGICCSWPWHPSASLPLHKAMTSTAEAVTTSERTETIFDELKGFPLTH